MGDAVAVEGIGELEEGGDEGETEVLALPNEIEGNEEAEERCSKKPANLEGIVEVLRIVPL